MNRRVFLQTAAAAALRAAPRRPNILYIMTDQQFAEALSCRMGDRYIKTPNMDSLAANGMFFTRAYCPNPLCVPSRTSLFTGRYPTETAIQTNDKASLDVKRFPLMGTMFRRAGYETGYFGKWHIPVPEENNDLHGFTGLNRKPKGAVDKPAAEQAVEFLRARRSAPFLLVTSFLNPHNICQWPRGEKFSEGDPGTPPPLDQCPPLRANHEVPKNETDTMLLMRRSYQATNMFPVGKYTDKQWREYIWAYYRMIELVDQRIGTVLKALREAGQEENTLIVFTADHGDCQGAHRWNQKTVFYDEAARVPFIVSYKGVTKRGTSDRLVHTGVDLIPTLCAYAGVEAPKVLPGLSLMATANGRQTKDPREYVVVCNRMVQGAEIDGRVPTPDGRMVRGQRYKYSVYSEGQRRESLVDMEKDPGEMVNVAGDAAMRPVLNRHREMLAAWCAKTGDRFPVPKVS